MIISIGASLAAQNNQTPTSTAPHHVGAFCVILHLFVRGNDMTLEEARQVLGNMGFEPPEFIVQGWLDLFATVQDCLDAHYTEATQKLMLASLIGLYGLSGGNRYINSQSAPSGASQSFRISDIKVMWKAGIGQLRLLDKHGCLNELVPANPNGGGAFLGVGKGGCYERNR